jgi:hypothetical protein
MSEDARKAEIDTIRRKTLAMRALSDEILNRLDGLEAE